MKILPPTVSLDEFECEFSRFERKISRDEYFNQDNLTSVKKIASYNFFTPYESTTEFANHMLAMIAAAPSFAVAAAATLCVAIIEAIQLVYKAAIEKITHTPADDADEVTPSDKKNKIGNPAVSLAFALVFAVLVPLAPVALLLGVLSRSVITVLSHLPERESVPTDHRTYSH